MRKILLLFILLAFTSADAQINYCTVFDGQSSYVNLGSSVSTGARSVSFYYRPAEDISQTSLSNVMAILIRQDATENKEWGFYVGATPFASFTHGHIVFHTRFNDNYQAVNSVATAWNAGQWYYICGVIDPVEGMKLYIDGVLQSTNPGVTQAIPAAPEPLIIGRWWTTTRYLQGSLDNLALWDRALTQAEINSMMCLTTPLNTDIGLIAFYDFNEYNSPVITDVMNDFDGSPANLSWDRSTICTQYYSANLNANMRVYPNPSQDEILLSFADVVSKDVQISVFNMRGEMVLSHAEQLSDEFCTRLLTSGLPTGIYIIKAVSGEDQFSATFEKHK